MQARFGVIVVRAGIKLRLLFPRNRWDAAVEHEHQLEWQPLDLGD